MNDKCFEIGTIQAFLDGETSPELSFELTDHAAKCDNCALLLAEAEEENSQVFAMLDRELNSLVPTQRLWSSITVALAEEKKQTSVWDKFYRGMLAVFASPSIAVAASVLVVFGIFAAMWNIKAPEGSIDGPIAAQVPVTSPATPPAQVNTTASEPISAAPSHPLRVNETNYSAKQLAKLATTANYRPESRSVRAEPAVVRTDAVSPYSGEYLPGEESYVRTISGLKQNVDSRKDLIMSPSTRVSFERDLAVVNDSIKKMKEVVRKNPKNQAAKQVLYSSYQNKIDLLNSVVEREELLASMQ